MLGDLKLECAGSCVQQLPGNMRQQAVNITQLVLAEHPQGWARRVTFSVAQLHANLFPTPNPSLSAPLMVLSVSQRGANLLDFSSSSYKTRFIIVMHREAGVQCMNLGINAFKMSVSQCLYVFAIKTGGGGTGKDQGKKVVRIPSGCFSFVQEKWNVFKLIFSLRINQPINTGLSSACHLTFNL